MKRTVRRYLKPYRAAFVCALFQVLGLSAFELLKPWPLKIIIDNVLAGAPPPWELIRGWSSQALLLGACAGLVLIYLFAGALRMLNDCTTVRIGQKMVNDLRRDLYSHIQRLSLAFHHRQQIGDLLYRVTADTLGIQSLTMNGLFSVISAATLLAMLVCPALFAVIALLNARMTAAATRARQKESTVYSLVQRSLAALRVIQAFTKEADEERRFLKASAESLAADLRLYNLQNAYYAVVSVTIAAGTAGILWLGARHVLTGAL